MASASEQIDAYIAGYPDWRGDRLARLRALVREAVPGATEEWKWGVPVWSLDGLLCSIGGFKEHVKLNFFHGAAMTDWQSHFNAGLDSKKMRAIDFHEGDPIDETAVKTLIRAAADHNRETAKR